MDLKLADKTALVSGAGSVIGEAVAERLVTEGAAVILWDRSVEALEDIAARLTAMGGEVELAGGLDEGAGLPAVAVQWRGGFQLAWLGHLTDMTSLRDAARLVDATADHLAAQGGGSLVLNSTTAASWEVPGVSAEYAAMGAAVTQFARRAAVRRAEDDVRVNAVCPGGIQDPRAGGVIDAPAVPLADAAPASDVADVVAFLLSPLASYTTGQAIVVDGGASII